MRKMTMKRFLTAKAAVTRPADNAPYIAGDIIANSTTAGSVVPLKFPVGTIEGRGAVTRVRLLKDDDDQVNDDFRLNLFDADPGTLGAGDNGVFAANVAMENYIGALDVGTTNKGKAGDGVNMGIDTPNTGTEMIFHCEDGILYGLLEARAGYTPGSGEKFTVILEIIA